MTKSNEFGGMYVRGLTPVIQRRVMLRSLNEAKRRLPPSQQGAFNNELIRDSALP